MSIDESPTIVHAGGGLSDQHRPDDHPVTTILIADDDEAIRRYASAVLRPEGYRILEATDGADAIRICERDPSIDLILTDVVMPHLGGQQLASHISSIRPGTKLLLMSGYPNLWGLLGGIATRTQKLQSTHHFLQKPFTPLQLRSKVRDLLTQTV